MGQLGPLRTEKRGVWGQEDGEQSTYAQLISRQGFFWIPNPASIIPDPLGLDEALVIFACGCHGTRHAHLQGSRRLSCKSLFGQKEV